MRGLQYSEPGQFKVLLTKKSIFHSFLLSSPFFCSKLPFSSPAFYCTQHVFVRFAAELNRRPTDALNSEVVVRRNPPGKCTTGGEAKNNSDFSLFPCFLSFALFLLRLLEGSMLNAEVKEGEILPPTIQRLMKGYNKYLRPFFDSKETADTCCHGNDRTRRGNVCLTENERGSYSNFVLVCPY